MSQGKTLEKVKKLRELTGVGFKDCKKAIDENNGDIEKSIEFLRKKGIAKANKKMERVAADGLISICEEKNKFSVSIGLPFGTYMFIILIFLFLIFTLALIFFFKYYIIK